MRPFIPPELSSDPDSARPASPHEAGRAPEAPAGAPHPPAGALSLDERAELRVGRAISDAVFVSRAFQEAVRHMNGAARWLRRPAPRAAAPEAPPGVLMHGGEIDPRIRARAKLIQALDRMEAADAAISEAIVNCSAALDALGGPAANPAKPDEDPER